MLGVEENPRVVKRAPPNAHAGATRFVEHPLRRFGRCHVAIADHGNRPHSFHDFADARQVHRSAKALFARAPVDEDGRDTDVFQGARKVCKVGGGSAMMTELGRTSALVKGMIEALKIPVTAKMRLGWDNDNITAPDLARTLEDVGVAAIFIHGRTREQGFGGTVNLAGIRKVVEAVRTIPVIGNGDVTTPEAAKRMFDETGCAGVSIGRGAFYNPWIFLHAQHYIATGELLEEPSFDERVRVMSRHLDLMVEIFGETHGCRMFRKVAPWYSKRLGPANEFNKRVVLLSSKADYYEILESYIKWREQFLDEDGKLKPQYQPAPLVASFMQEPGVANRAAIPVPKGPVEVW
jgi:nifR3 family TIM-barrel protein